MSAIAAYRTAVLQLLDDTALDRYTNNQVDQALLWALGEYSKVRPIMRTYSFTGLGTYRAELPADFVALHVTQVVMDDGTDPPTIVPFKALYFDESWWLETIDRILSTSDTVDITYDTYQTIDGLASASGTTVPEDDEWLISTGAAGRAAMIRAVSRSESINMQPEVQFHLLDTAKAFLQSFMDGLRADTDIQVIQMDDPDDQF